MNMPRNTSTTCIRMRMTMGCTGRSTTRLVMPEVTPVKASTWLKAAEPVRMISTITAMEVVVPTASLVTLQVSLP